MAHRAMLFVIVSTLLVAGTVSAQTPRSVQVSGTGEALLEPDIATVEMGIFVFNKDLPKGKKEADAKIASLLTAISSLAVAPEDIRTTQLYLSPKYDESDDNWDLVGYEITRSLTVTLRDLKKLNELIDKSIEAGANRLEEIELSSSKEQESKDKTLAEAIMDAKQHATRLAEGFGAKLGKVLLIDANKSSYVSLYSMLPPTFGEATFQPGRIKIASEVRAVFELTD